MSLLFCTRNLAILRRRIDRLRKVNVQSTCEVLETRLVKYKVLDSIGSVLYSNVECNSGL
jgi:hypothetical protein